MERPDGILDLGFDQGGRIARDRQFPRQILGEGKQLCLHLERVLPAPRTSGQAENVVLGGEILGIQGEAAQQLVQRPRGIAQALFAHLGP